MIRLPLILLLSVALNSCDFLNFADKANTQFADQHFKTAIAGIELYKLRYGQYPESIESLTFLGEWDKMALQSVKYERLDTGYSLDVISGVIKGQPTDLTYPQEFWKGLGLKKSNLLNSDPL